MIDGIEVDASLCADECEEGVGFLGGGFFLFLFLYEPLQEVECGVVFLLEGLVDDAVDGLGDLLFAL